jgi:hypothetical protein
MSHDMTLIFAICQRCCTVQRFRLRTLVITTAILLTGDLIAPATILQSLSYITSLQVETEVGFGERVAVDLVPGGSSTAVTADNVQRYITAYADHLLNGAIARQFGAFQRGFLRLCSGKALHLFRWVNGCVYVELQLSLFGCLADGRRAVPVDYSIESPRARAAWRLHFVVVGAKKGDPHQQMPASCGCAAARRCTSLGGWLVHNMSGVCSCLVEGSSG